MSDKPNVIEALAAVMGEVRAIRKDDRNSQQGYSFRGIDAVMNAVGPVLRKHGVVVMPICEDVHYRDVTTSTGKPSRECTVKVRYRFYGPGFDFIDAVTVGESMDFGDKGAPKAMAVAFRIALLQALCMPTDDPDPDAATYERAAQGGKAIRQAGRPAPRTATQARADLGQTCTENGWDIDRVAARFAKDYGGPLGEATDPAVIDQFRQDLFAFSDAALKPVVVNGAAS